MKQTFQRFAEKTFKRQINSLFGIKADLIQQGIESLILGMLVLAVFLFSASPLTRAYALPFYVVAFFIMGSLFMLYKKRGSSDEMKSKGMKIIVFALTAGVLFWISNTGWFFSPFFYLLYLVVLSIAFLFSPSVVLTFVILLVAVLLPSIENVKSEIDLVSLLSLGLIIPLSYFLRREYLVRVQKEKKILILQEEKADYKNVVEKTLANKITNFAVEIREPINDIKQLATYAVENKDGRDTSDIKKIVESSEKAIQMLKRFEEESTGRKIVKTPKSKKKKARKRSF